MMGYRDLCVLFNKVVQYHKPLCERLVIRSMNLPYNLTFILDNPDIFQGRHYLMDRVRKSVVPEGMHFNRFISIGEIRFKKLCSWFTFEEKIELFLSAENDVVKELFRKVLEKS